MGAGACRGDFLQCRAHAHCLPGCWCPCPCLWCRWTTYRWLREGRASKMPASQPKILKTHSLLKTHITLVPARVRASGEWSSSDWQSACSIADLFRITTQITVRRAEGSPVARRTDSSRKDPALTGSWQFHGQKVILRGHIALHPVLICLQAELCRRRQAVSCWQRSA